MTLPQGPAQGSGIQYPGPAQDKDLALILKDYFRT